jgi:FkbM family methyltransferase
MGRAMVSALKSALKAVRDFYPLNYAATSALRAVGVKSDFFVRRFPRVGLVEAALPNGRILRYYTRGDDGISNQVFWRGWDGYEPETVRMFFRLATLARVTLDIGAHVGTFSLLGGHANPDGAVIAFEPLPANYQRLRTNVTLNGLRNVRCIEAAVSDRSGNAEFYTSSEITIPDMSSLQMSSIVESFKQAYHGRLSGLSKLNVRVVTVDDVVQEFGIERVDLAKIDAEGVEPQVLNGMAKTLRRDRPALIVEVLKGFGTAQRLEEILAPYDYRYYLLTADGPEWRDHIEGQADGHWEWRNYLLTTMPPEEVRALGH